MRINPLQRVLTIGKVKEPEEGALQKWLTTYGATWQYLSFGGIDPILVVLLPDYAQIESPHNPGDYSHCVTFFRPDGQPDTYYLDIIPELDALETEAQLLSDPNIEEKRPDDYDLARVSGALSLEQALARCQEEIAPIEDASFRPIHIKRTFQLVNAARASGNYENRYQKCILAEIREKICPPEMNPKLFFASTHTYYHWSLGLIGGE